MTLAHIEIAELLARLDRLEEERRNKALPERRAPLERARRHHQPRVLRGGDRDQDRAAPGRRDRARQCDEALKTA
jgi:hypothetical protein